MARARDIERLDSVFIGERSQHHTRIFDSWMNVNPRLAMLCSKLASSLGTAQEWRAHRENDRPVSVTGIPLSALKVTDRNLLIQGFFIGASVRPGLRGCRGRKGENSDFAFISMSESGF